MILGRFSAFAVLRRKVFWGAGVVAAAAATAIFFGVDFGTSDAPPAFRGQIQAFQTKQPPADAPDLTFTDADGQARRLADFKGKVVLLNFWATWCVPCVEEMPSLEKLHAKLGSDQFTVIALSVDREGQSIVKPFVERLGLAKLPVYLDRSGASMRTFGVRGLPTTVLIDKEGREAGRLEGIADWNSDSAAALVRHYMPPVAPQRTASAR